MADKVLSYRAQLKDEASAAAAQIATNVAAADKATTGFGERLVSSGGRIREFRKAGLELANVASLIPGPWGDAATSVGKVISMSGEIGLLSRAVVDLGGSALGFAGRALGMGTAAATAATGIAVEGAAATATAAEVGTLTVAQDAAAASSIAWWGRLGLLAAVAAPLAAAVGEIRQNDDRLTEAQKKVADGSATMYDRLAAQAAAHHAAAEAAKGDGAIHLDLQGIFRGATSAVDGLLQSLLAQKRANEAAALAAKVASGYFRQFTTAAGETGAGLDIVGTAAYAGAHGIDAAGAAATAAGNAAVTAANKFAYLARTQASMGNRTATDVRDVFGPTGSPIATTGGMSATDAYLGGAFDTHVHYTPPKATKSGGASGVSAAAAAATAAIAAAYSAEKVAGDNASDELHRRNTQVITDAQQAARKKIDADHQATQLGIENAHRLADEQIQASRKSVDRQLAEQKRLNARPVTDAEKRQAAIEAGEQLRDLSATAQASPNDIHAQEALANFQAHQQIDALREQQAQQDAAAEAAAQTAKDQLDGQQQTEDDTYRQNRADEQATYDSRMAAEEDRYKAKQATEDARASLQKKMFDDHVAALEKSKNASVGLAEIETRRYLQEQVSLARQALAAATTETEKAAAKGDLNNAQYDLTHGAPHHAAGGWVGLNGPELGWLGENGPEYVVPNGGAGGGGDVHMHGDIIVNGAGKSSTEIANEVLLAFKREVNRQRISMIPS